VRPVAEVCLFSPPPTGFLTYHNFFTYHNKKQVMEGLQSTAAEGQDRQTEVERVTGLVMQAVASDIQRMAELFVSKKDHELFGRTEFQLRDLLLKAGARATEAVLEDRKKGVPRQQHRLSEGRVYHKCR